LICAIGYLIYANFSNSKNHNQLLKQIPHLTLDEAINYFDASNNKERTDISKIQKRGVISVIFIFSQPCTPCEKNLTFWKKITSVSKKKIDIYGIVFGDISEATRFSESLKLNFPIFIPTHEKQFKKKFRVKFNLSQTILCREAKVIYCKAGELSTDDYFEIVKIIKEREK
jgi:peroxiredoxin